MSVVPFAAIGPMHKMISEILNEAKVEIKSGDISGLFNPNAPAPHIDIFSVQLPYQPMLMDSIFNPIGEAWNRAMNRAETRESFLIWRKSRELFETVPAAPAKKFAMLRGWYVAKALNLLTENNEDFGLGPKLGIWSPQNMSNESFPHPLATVEPAEIHDYPGAIMNSLAIALVLCNNSSSLQPLYAYQRLVELGDVTSRASELVMWIIGGKLKNEGYQPEPKSARAGTKSDTMEERRQALLKFFKQESDLFKAKIESIDTRLNQNDINLTWELREYIREALDSILNSVETASDTSSGI
jgi:hypothetical protein